MIWNSGFMNLTVLLILFAFCIEIDSVAIFLLDNTWKISLLVKDGLGLDFQSTNKQGLHIGMLFKSIQWSYKPQCKTLKKLLNNYSVSPFRCIMQ